ncbi:MAG: glycosyltransferase [Candidatus Micrarchaeia archaeon]
MPERYRISIVIPTIEEDAAFGVIRRIKGLFNGDAEIIVVDKSSKAYKNKLAATGAKVIDQEDSGYENAVMAGFRAAHGKVFASIDPDGTYDPNDMLKGLKLIEEGKAEVVFGNRFAGKDDDAMTKYISFGNRSLTSIYNRLYKAKIHDVLTGIFMFTSKAFESIRDVEPYRAGTAFFAIELSKQGYKIKEIPIRYMPRTSGKSKLSRSKFAYGLGVAGHMIRFFRDYSPLLLFGGIGAVLILAGIAVGVMVLANYIATGTLNEVGRALIAFMLVTIGFLSIIAGLIIDLLLQISKKIERL